MKLDDFIQFNPKEILPKGQTFSCVDMSSLQPFTRKPITYFTSTYKGGSKFKNGDTIMARITPCLENGKTSFINFLSQNEIAFGSTEFIVARAIPNVSLPLFVYYLLCSKRIRDIAISSMTGSSGRERVQQISLNEIEIPDYSLAFQQHIVDTIGTVDDLIEKNEEIIANARSLNNAFYDTIIVETGISILKDFFVITIGRTPPTKENKWFSSSSRGNVKWLSIKDMAQNSTYIFETSQFLTHDALKKFNIPIVKEGDVLLSFKLTVGRTAIAGANMVTNEAIACFKANPEYRNYLFCYLQRCNFLSDGDNTSSIGKAVNSTIIRNFPFVIPSKESLDTFNKETHSLFELIKLKQKENISLKTQKGTLLCKYFSSN